MLCVNCGALDADVAYFDKGKEHYVCNEKCLQEYLDEAARVAEQPKAADFREERGSLGEATEL
jgi:YHS domain-containing protein